MGRHFDAIWLAVATRASPSTHSATTEHCRRSYLCTCDREENPRDREDEASRGYIHRDRNRRFFDRTKAAGVQMRTTGAHIHAKTAVERTYTVPFLAQLKFAKSQNDRPALTRQLKTGRNNGNFEF